jgi:hypothetical protein
MEITMSIIHDEHPKDINNISQENRVLLPMLAEHTRYSVASN